MKIRQVRAELFGADGRTDMTKLTVAFRNFANAPVDGVSWRQHKPLDVVELYNYFIALLCNSVTTRPWQYL